MPQNKDNISKILDGFSKSMSEFDEKYPDTKLEELKKSIDRLDEIVETNQKDLTNLERSLEEAKESLENNDKQGNELLEDLTHKDTELKDIDKLQYELIKSESLAFCAKQIKDIDHQLNNIRSIVNSSNLQNDDLFRLDIRDKDLLTTQNFFKEFKQNIEQNTLIEIRNDSSVIKIRNDSPDQITAYQEIPLLRMIIHNISPENPSEVLSKSFQEFYQIVTENILNKVAINKIAKEEIDKQQDELKLLIQEIDIRIPNNIKTIDNLKQQIIEKENIIKKADQAIKQMETSLHEFNDRLHKVNNKPELSIVQDAPEAKIDLRETLQQFQKSLLDLKDEKLKDQFIRTINQANSELAKLNDALSQNNQEVHNLQQKLVQVENINNEFRDNYDISQNEIKRLQNEIKELEEFQARNKQPTKSLADELREINESFDEDDHKSAGDSFSSQAVGDSISTHSSFDVISNPDSVNSSFEKIYDNEELTQQIDILRQENEALLKELAERANKVAKANEETGIVQKQLNDTSTREKKLRKDNAELKQIIAENNKEKEQNPSISPNLTEIDEAAEGMIGSIDKLIEETNRLRQENSNLQEQNTKKSTELEELQDFSKKQKENILTIIEENEKLKNKNTTILTKVEELEQQNLIQNNQIEHQNVHNNDLQERFDNLQREHSTINKELEDKLKLFQDEKNALEPKLTEALTIMTGNAREIETLQSLLSNSTNQNKLLESDLAKSAEENNALKLTNNNLQERFDLQAVKIDQFKDVNLNLEKKTQELNEANITIINQKDALSNGAKAFNEIKEEKSELEKKFNETINKASTTSKENEELNKKIGELEKGNGLLNNIVQKQENTIKQQQTDNEKYQVEFRQLKEDDIKKQQIISSQASEIEKLKAELLKTQEQTLAAQQKIDQQGKEIEQQKESAHFKEGEYKKAIEMHENTIADLKEEKSLIAQNLEQLHIETKKPETKEMNIQTDELTKRTSEMNIQTDPEVQPIGVHNEQTSNIVHDQEAFKDPNNAILRSFQNLSIQQVNNINKNNLDNDVLEKITELESVKAKKIHEKHKANFKDVRWQKHGQESEFIVSGNKVKSTSFQNTNYITDNYVEVTNYRIIDIPTSLTDSKGPIHMSFVARDEHGNNPNVNDAVYVTSHYKDGKLEHITVPVGTYPLNDQPNAPLCVKRNGKISILPITHEKLKELQTQLSQNKGIVVPEIFNKKGEIIAKENIKVSDITNQAIEKFRKEKDARMNILSEAEKVRNGLGSSVSSGNLLPSGLNKSHSNSINYDK